MENQKDTIKKLLAKKDRKALEEHLKQGMAAYLDSETYKKFLSFSALFPHYSAGNRHLIFSQNEDAQFVAGFKKWKELGNPIKKGGKSLKILAPYKYFLKDGKGDKVLDDNDEPIERTGYRFVSVFDQTQTEHPEKIPSQLKEIKGDYSTEPKAFLNIMNALQTTTTASITLAPIAEDKTYGYFEPKTNRIVLKEGMGQKKTVAIALHEITHSRLHREFSGNFGDTEYSKNEFEAESVAYIVGTTLGIDMSETSFGYMKSWQPNEKNLSALQESFETIKQESEKMIEEIDKKLAALQQPEESKNRSPLAEIEAARGKKIGENKKTYEQKSEKVESNSRPLAR